MIRWTSIVGVFIISVAVRWTSCGDSFWVDELHTAWCVDGTFDQVAERAKIGNQQPIYFDAIYIWQHCLPASLAEFYGIEAALRVTSVLLTALSAAWLVVIVSGGCDHEKKDHQRVASPLESVDGLPPSHPPERRDSTSPNFVGRGKSIVLVGGIAAGLALALDRDAIFFGTELRPYAAIMFIVTAALAVARRLVETEARTNAACTTKKISAPSPVRIRDIAMRVALHGLVLIAAAVHITSLIVLAPQLLIFAISDVWRHCKVSRSRYVVTFTHLAAGIAWLMIAAWWFRSHTALWQSRGNWNSFATVDGWSDVWTMWPWGALVLLPIAGWLVACGLRGVSWRRMIRQTEVVMALLILIGVLSSTIACYLLTAYADIPLWHRRYLIASLPLLCAVMGWFIGAIRYSGIAVAFTRPLEDSRKTHHQARPEADTRIAGGVSHRAGLTTNAPLAGGRHKYPTVSPSGLAILSSPGPVADATGSGSVGLRPKAIALFREWVKAAWVQFGLPCYRVALALACLFLLTDRQDTLSKWSRGDTQLVRRRENWKTAITLIRNSAVDGDRVWVDAGLIEQNEQPTLVSDAKTEEYLRYVTGGPYRLGEHAQPIGIGRDAIDKWLNAAANAKSSENASPRFLITRRASRRIVNLPPGVARYRFGSVTVLLRQ